MACGVLPPGLVQSFLAAIASIISRVFIGSLASASTCAAASISPSRSARLLAAIQRSPRPSARAGTEPGPIKAPLKASTTGNYFEDASGTPLILCGSQTWNTLQDWGTNGTVQPLDFDAFVGFLKDHGHNLTLLWYTELPRFRGLPTTEKSLPDFTVAPHPWMRTGPGQATDGRLKFDLTKFNPEYFDRLRTRVKVLHRAGIYVGVYLFTGEFP